MKKFLFLLLFLSPLTFFLSTQNVRAQVTWTDSLQAKTTSVDTTFSPRWSGAVLWFSGGAGKIKFGTCAEDTVDWSSKSWLYLQEGQSFGIWQDEFYGRLLWRLEYKAVQDSCTLNIAGYKTVYQ